MSEETIVRFAGFLLLTSCLVSGAEVPWPVEGQFQVPLGGRSDRVRAFAASDTGLYFAVGNTILHTDFGGAVESAAAAGKTVDGMVVDRHGTLFVLTGAQTLLTYDAHGAQTQAISLDAPAESLTLVGGAPWGLGADHRLGPLLPDQALDPARKFVIQHSGPPLTLSPVKDRTVAFLEGDSIRILDIGTGGLASRSLAQWLRGHSELGLRTLIAGPENGMLVLGTTREPDAAWILQLNAAGRPLRELRMALPPQAEPRLMAAASGRLFLADSRGMVWYGAEPTAQIPVEQRMDSEPVLLSDIGPLERALRKAGVAGRPVELTFTVDAVGRVRDLRIRQPLGSVVPEEEMGQLVGRLRFEPAVKDGRNVESIYRLELGR